MIPFFFISFFLPHFVYCKHPSQFRSKFLCSNLLFQISTYCTIVVCAHPFPEQDYSCQFIFYFCIAQYHKFASGGFPRYRSYQHYQHFGCANLWFYLHIKWFIMCNFIRTYSNDGQCFILQVCIFQTISKVRIKCVDIRLTASTFIPKLLAGPVANARFPWAVLEPSQGQVSDMCRSQSWPPAVKKRQKAFLGEADLLGALPSVLRAGKMTRS